MCCESTGPDTMYLTCMYATTIDEQFPRENLYVSSWGIHGQIIAAGCLETRPDLGDGCFALSRSALPSALHPSILVEPSSIAHAALVGYPRRSREIAAATRHALEARVRVRPLSSSLAQLSLSHTHSLMQKKKQIDHNWHPPTVLKFSEF